MESSLFQTDQASAIISGVNRFLGSYRLVLTDKYVYLINKGSGVFAKALGMQFGVLGSLISTLFNSKKEKTQTASQEGKSLDQIVAEDEKSIKIAYEQIQQYEAKMSILSRGAGGFPLTLLTTEYGKCLIQIQNKEDVEKTLEVLQSKCPGKEKK